MGDNVTVKHIQWTDTSTGKLTSVVFLFFAFTLVSNHTVYLFIP